MTCRISYDHTPKLPDSILVAAWPGMGYVALRAANYLVQKLNAAAFAELSGVDLFPLESVAVRDGLLQPPQNPRNRFFHAKESGPGIVTFLGDAQPVSGKERELAEAILDVAATVGCSLIVTFAAYATHISHTDQHAAWGTSNEPALNQTLENSSVKIMTEGTISGLNGSLLAMAHDRGFRCACLLGEIPLYALQIEYPKASLVILETFKSMYNIDLDLKNLQTLTESTSQQIDSYLKQLKNVGELAGGLQEEIPPDPQTLH